VVCSKQERDARVLYRGGQSSSVTTATGRAKSGERVQWVPDVEVSVQVQGEVKASAESTGRGDVLARSGASWRASMPILAGAGRVWARVAWAMSTSTWSRAGRVSISKVQASSETWWSGLDGRGEGVSMWSDKVAGMVLFLSRWSKCRAGKAWQ
jgi:hypothetical protein